MSQTKLTLHDIEFVRRLQAGALEIKGIAKEALDRRIFQCFVGNESFEVQLEIATKEADQITKILTILEEIYNGQI